MKYRFWFSCSSFRITFSLKFQIPNLRKSRHAYSKMLLIFWQYCITAFLMSSASNNRLFSCKGNASCAASAANLVSLGRSRSNSSHIFHRCYAKCSMLQWHFSPFQCSLHLPSSLPPFCFLRQRHLPLSLTRAFSTTILALLRPSLKSNFSPESLPLPENGFRTHGKRRYTPSAVITMAK